MYTSIIEIQLQPGKMDEAKEMSEAMAPELGQIDGCRQFIVIDKGDDAALVLAIYDSQEQQAAAAPKAEKAAPKAEAPKADAAAGDDLTKITGVGPAAAKKLNDAGITSFAQLAEVDVDSFDAVKIKPEWTQQAKELAGK